MHRRLLTSLSILLVLAVAAPVAGAASGPTLTSMRVYREPAGPHAGLLAAIATVDLRGFVRAGDLPTATSGPRARATLLLTNSGKTVRVADSVRIHPAAGAGVPARFDFRIPASRALALGDAIRMKVRITVAIGGRSAAVRPLGAGRATRQFGFGGFGGCVVSFICGVSQQPAPAPNVAFASGNSLVCLAFNGSGYADPALYNVSFWDAAGNALGDSDDPSVAANGTWTDSFWWQPVGGYAENGPSVTGTVPVAALQAPATSALGPLEVMYTGPQYGLFASPIVLPYSTAPTDNDC